MIPTYAEHRRRAVGSDHRGRLPVLLVGLLLAVAGCGSAASSTEDAGTPTTPPTSSAPTSPPTSPSTGPTKPAEVVPNCTDVWVDGQTMPATYRGCLDDSGAKVRGRPIYCEQGNRLYLYGGEFYALANHPVHHSPHGLKKDRVFRALVRDCTG